MKTRDIKKPDVRLPENKIGTGRYKLPIKQVGRPEIINLAVNKISAIVKNRAINFLSDKPVKDLDYELSVLIEQVWNDGYNKGMTTGETINQL